MKQLLVVDADNRGVTAIEYALIAVLVAMVAVTGFQLLGTTVSGTINSVAQSL